MARKALLSTCLSCKAVFTHNSHAVRKYCQECLPGIRAQNTYEIHKGKSKKGHPGLKGELSPRWRGGKPKCISCKVQLSSVYAKRCIECAGKAKRKDNPKKKERQIAMRRREYILWRIAVFMRDDYTCQICSVKGGVLNADHIKPWALYPELRYAIDNGRTLCVNCHRQTDTWGYRKANSVERVTG